MNQQSIRKAAVLLESLDPASQQKLLAQMDPELARQVYAHIGAIGRVSDGEREAVLNDFVKTAEPNVASNKSGESQPNVMYNHEGDSFVGSGTNTIPFPKPNRAPQFAYANTASRPAPNMPQQPYTQDTHHPFAFLESQQPANLAKFLNAEATSVQAVVLASIQRDLAAQTIALMDKSQQVDIVRRLSSLKEVDPDSVSIIANSLIRRIQFGDQPSSVNQHQSNEQKTNLSNRRQPAHGYAGSPSSTVHSTTKPTDRHLSLYQPDESEDISSVAQSSERSRQHDGAENPLSFQQVMHMPSRDLDTLLRCAKPRHTIIALRGADQNIVKRVLSRLPKNEAREVAQKIKDIGPLQIREIRDAQMYLVDLAHQLTIDGKINGANSSKLRAA